MQPCMSAVSLDGVRVYTRKFIVIFQRVDFQRLRGSPRFPPEHLLAATPDWPPGQSPGQSPGRSPAWSPAWSPGGFLTNVFSKINIFGSPWKALKRAGGGLAASLAASLAGYVFFYRIFFWRFSGNEFWRRYPNTMGPHAHESTRCRHACLQTAPVCLHHKICSPG